MAIICTVCYDEKKKLSYLTPGETDEKGRTKHVCGVCGHIEVTQERENVRWEEETGE